MFNPKTLSRQFASFFFSATTGIAFLTASLSCVDTYAQEETKEDPSVADFELNPAQIIPLIRSGKADQVIEKLDAALAKDPLEPKLLGIELQVASMMMSTKPQVGTERMKNLVDKLQGVSDPSDGILNSYLSAVLNYSSYMGREKPEDGLKLIEQAETKVAGKNVAQESSLTLTKARFLMQMDRIEDAKSALEASYVKARERAVAERYMINQLVNIALSYDSMLGEKYADDAKAKLTDVESMIREKLTGESVDLADVQALLSLKMSLSSQLTYTNAAKAKEMLQDLKTELTILVEKLPEAERQNMTRSLTMIDQNLDRIESAVRREKLIGTIAPELDAEEFVGMEPATLHDLKGKVVLLDFWAVWCGPCIATFPHLQHLHESYNDKGLVILGITRPYSYKWNEETMRAEKADDVSMEDEMEMLKKFREQHKLEHGFVVTPKDSKYSKAFEVTGIPQAVLLDKDGAIRLIKVGSGDANSKAIEEMIKTLLDL